jgi:hypothetical protein
MKPETEPQKTNGNAPILSRNSESSNGPGRLMIRTGLHHFVLSKAVQHPFLITSSGNDGGAGSKLLTPSEPEIQITSPLFFEQANPGKPAGEFIFSSHSPKNIDAGLRQPGNPSPVFGPVQATVTLPAAECLITPCQRYLLGSRRSSHPPREMILPLALPMNSSPLWPENLSPTSAEMPKSPAVFSFSQEYKRRCWT